jgi:hypothetical protein
MTAALTLKSRDGYKNVRSYVLSLIPTFCTQYKTIVDMTGNKEAMIVVVCDV